jgi:hypothetical protein
LFQNEVQKALARAVYVTGQPLSIFEHPLWKQALQLLRPNFNPPSRKMLSTVLLEEEYEDVKQKVTEKIEDANVLHIAADGWTNIRKDSILNIIIYTPKPYFHSSIDTQDNRHTAEYLSEKISQTMNEIGSAKFLGIITDNAANMKKCGKLLTDQYENTTWVGCLAHTLNLLIGDVLKIDSVQETFKSVIAIVKSVLQSNIYSAEFKKIALEKSLNVTLLFPVKTRWGSYLHCLENFLKSKSILQSMVVNENNRDLQKHKLKLLSETTWQDVANQITFLKPIVKWITILEGDSCSIHLVHRALKEIEEELESDNSKSIFEEVPLRDLKLKFKTRKENCVKPIHLAAVILDPKNQGATLNNDEYLDGCSTIMTIAQCDAALLQELSDYKCRKGLWERPLIWQATEDVDPISWWLTFFPKTVLAKTAQKVLSVPSTSASVERSFSTHGNIHTKKRNKLKTERAAKICYISHNWKLMNKALKIGGPARSPRSDSNTENTENSSQIVDDVASWDLSFELENFDFRSVTDLDEDTDLSE